MAAVAGGSADALEHLYDRYAATAYGLARRILAQQDQAEEVVQDVFAQVWRDANRYDATRASVAGWIVLLTRTRAIDRLRARRARPDQDRAVEPAAVAPLATRDRSPEQVAISSEDARAVRAALDMPDLRMTEPGPRSLAYGAGGTSPMSGAAAGPTLRGAGASAANPRVFGTAPTELGSASGLAASSASGTNATRANVVATNPAPSAPRSVWRRAPKPRQRRVPEAVTPPGAPSSILRAPCTVRGLRPQG